MQMNTKTLCYTAPSCYISALYANEIQGINLPAAAKPGKYHWLLSSLTNHICVALLGRFTTTTGHFTCLAQCSLTLPRRALKPF